MFFPRLYRPFPPRSNPPVRSVLSLSRARMPSGGAPAHPGGGGGGARWTGRVFGVEGERGWGRAAGGDTQARTTFHTAITSILLPIWTQGPRLLRTERRADPCMGPQYAALGVRASNSFSCRRRPHKKSTHKRRKHVERSNRPHGHRTSPPMTPFAVSSASGPARKAGPAPC